MKLFYDLFKSLFARLAILLVVATVMIIIEANSQNEKFIGKEEAHISDKLASIDKFLSKKIADRQNRITEKNKLARKVTQKSKAIKTINDRLERSRKAKLGDKAKLNPVEFSKNVHNLAKRSIERTELSIDYSKTMFMIVDINKQIADKTLQRTHLNGKLILVQNSSFLDIILKQTSPTSLLTPSNKTILLALSYALFFGALTLKAINFFLIAPLARKTDPITITADRKNNNPSIQYDESRKEFHFELEKDNSLIVKPGWFSLNTDGTTKTRLFWELKKPFASYATGLVNMTEFVPDTGRVREIKIASEQDPNRYIIPVQLKNHPGYIVKHGHLVATCGNDLRMKTEWGLWNWKNWLFGNLRYVFLTGTGTVYIYGYGNVSACEANNPDFRIKERHLVGYDTRTPFRMIRTETFINYWLNDTPLYDIQFPGKGNFLQQQSYGQSDDKIFRGVLEDIFGAIGKLLGL